MNIRFSLRKIRTVAASLLLLFVVASCNKVPDHARYIPKDAILVSGLNIKSLGKKIAWEVLTGSKIFKQMQNRVPEKGGNPDALSGLDKSGIDIFNTFYVYIKTDKRYSSGASVTGLIPLTDAAKWEEFVKKAFPKSEIKDHNGRKETGFGSMYLGWNKNLLIVINSMGSADQYLSLIKNNNLGAALKPEEIAELSAEMDKAFAVSSDNSLMNNKKFDSLQKSDHDVTLWLNYEEIMNQYGSENMAQMTGGVALSNTLWKDAAMTMGFDFNKGNITGTIAYYLPEKLKNVGVEFGSANIDKDMLQRLPAENMDMLIATHCAPQAIKTMMDTTGLTGIANSSLAGASLTMDEILDAFSGDFAFNMNDLNVKSQNNTVKTTVNMNFVIKINNKEHYNKLYQMATEMLQSMNPAVIKPNDNNLMIPLMDEGNDTVFYTMDDKYAMLSNKRSNISGFFNSSFMSQKTGQPAFGAITAHPWAMYFDIQQFSKNIDPSSVISNDADSLKLEASKHLLKSITFNGGEFVHNAMNYNIDISFMNTDNNALLTLLDYSMKLQDADKKATTNTNF